MCNYQPYRSLSDEIRDTLLTETFLNGNHMFGFQSMLRGCGKNEKKVTQEVTIVPLRQLYITHGISRHIRPLERNA